MTMADNLKFSRHKEIKGKNSYIHYENYDAIEVPYTDAIPSDYDGKMGVPISFLDKYCPEQFEIIGQTQGDSGKELVLKPFPRELKKLNPSLRDGQLYYIDEEGIPCVIDLSIGANDSDFASEVVVELRPGDSPFLQFKEESVLAVLTDIILDMSHAELPKGVHTAFLSEVDQHTTEVEHQRVDFGWQNRLGAIFFHHSVWQFSFFNYFCSRKTEMQVQIYVLFCTLSHSWRESVILQGP
jgi:hypothetical protein